MKKLSIIASLLLSLLPIAARAEFIELETEKENSDGRKFDDIIAQDGNVVVKFHATWCPACKKSAQPFKEASEKNNAVTFVSVDVDKFPELSNQYGAMSIPTFVYFSNGEKIDSEVGGKSTKEQVHQAVNERFSNVKSSVDAHESVVNKETAPQQHAQEAGILAKLKALVVWIFTKIKDLFVGIIDTIKGFFGR